MKKTPTPHTTSRVRNCASCDNEESCRQLAKQWGPSAMACRRARRDECFRVKGSLPLRTCARCGAKHYTPWCTGCGFTAAPAPLASANEGSRSRLPPWRRCDWSEAQQYRSRILTGSVGLEGTWDDWAEGRPEHPAMNRDYEYRTFAPSPHDSGRR